MKPAFLLLFLFWLPCSQTLLWAQSDTLKKTEKKSKRDSYTDPFKKRHFSHGYWMLGLYAGTENVETVSFGINFPIINQNSYTRLIPKREINTKDTSSLLPFTSFAAPASGRYWIPIPLPKRLALNIGLERQFTSLVYRPEIGLVATPFSLFFNTIGEGNIYLNHILLSTEYLPPIRDFDHTVRIGGGYMLKLTRPLSLLMHSHAIRLYVLYQYQLSRDWQGHLLTLQLHYNKEPMHKKFNPINTGYRNW